MIGFGRLTKQSMPSSRNLEERRCERMRTTTNTDRSLLRGISGWVRRQMILGDVAMIFVSVEIDGVITHAVALAGLVVDL